MSKPERISDMPRLYQWKTDDEPCQGLDVGPHSSLIIEVRGDLGGKTVKLLGGLTKGDADELAFLDEVSRGCLVMLPAVSYLLPVTDAVGITITFRGLA